MLDSQVFSPLVCPIGHCRQHRFVCCPLVATYFLRALRYVERNPARAYLVSDPWVYLWSSALAYCTGDDPTGLLDLTEWRTHWYGESWREYLALPEEPGEVTTLRLVTTIGRPIGASAFISRLEEQTGRRFQVSAVGRQRKEGMPGSDT